MVGATPFIARRRHSIAGNVGRLLCATDESAMEPPRSGQAWTRNSPRPWASDQRRAHTRSKRARRAARDGLSAPPLSLAFLGRASLTVKTRFRKKRSKLMDWRATATGRRFASALSAVGDAPRGRGAASSFTKGRPARGAEEPVVEQPHKSLRDHRRAERQRAMATASRCKTGAGGAAEPPPARRRLRRGPGRGRGGPLGAAQPRAAAARGTVAAQRPAPAAPTRSPVPSAASRVAVADPRRPTPRWTRTSSAAAPPPRRTAVDDDGRRILQRPSRTRGARSSCAPRRRRTTRTTLPHQMMKVRCGCDRRKRSPTTAPTMH